MSIISDDEKQGLSVKYLENMLRLSRHKKDDKIQRDQFCQNSLIYIKQDSINNRKPINILFVPAYLRCHFRNMTEMDIQNLSCTFVATMNISFYLGKVKDDQSAEQRQIVEQFADNMHDIIKQNLKLTFQNDFVINMSEDLTHNVSDSDRLVRMEKTKFKTKDVTRYYSNVIITRGFKFGLHSDIFLFPLEQNILDLVTTIHPIKVDKDKIFDSKLSGSQKAKDLIIRFNCMNLEIEEHKPYSQGNNQYEQTYDNYMRRIKRQNNELIIQLKELYMLETNGTELSDQDIITLFTQNKNYPFFRDIKISFPLKKNATEFGYYHIIQQDIKIDYTNQKQISHQEQTCYEKLKNFLFCRKKVVNFEQTLNYQQMIGHVAAHAQIQGFQSIPTEDRSQQQSFCNAIMSIPMLKASLGTIIQLCIPIFFLSFLTLVEFLYSFSTLIDQVRGLKISSSTLIVATYISFIYLMRTVIPPTPSWSFFEVAVCLLAASCLAPIIESIYQPNITNADNPFLVANGLFIACFVLNGLLCFIIILMLIVVQIYMNQKTKRQRSVRVTMGELLNNLTKKYFFLWRNSKCKNFLQGQINHKNIEVYSDWNNQFRQMQEHQSFV